MDCLTRQWNGFQLFTSVSPLSLPDLTNNSGWVGRLVTWEGWRCMDWAQITGGGGEVGRGSHQPDSVLHKPDQEEDMAGMALDTYRTVHLSHLETTKYNHPEVPVTQCIEK